MRAYFSEHDSLGTGADARGPALFSVKAGARRFIAVYPAGTDASWNAGAAAVGPRRTGSTT